MCIRDSPTLIFLLCGLKMPNRLLINTIGYGKLSGLLRLFVSRNKRNSANLIADTSSKQDSFYYKDLKMCIRDRLKRSSINSEIICKIIIR